MSVDSFVRVPSLQEDGSVHVEAVKTVLQRRKVANPQVDQYRAEQEFRRLLEQQKREWMSIYIRVLATLFVEIEQEREDAQIAMLLFDM